MLKSVSDTRDQVRDFIRRYAAFRTHDVEKIFAKGPKGRTTAIEVRTIADVTKVLSLEGRAHLAKADLAAQLTADELHDLTAITEELEVGASEMGAAVEPDAVFAKLAKQDKHVLTERVPVERVDSDIFRARLRGDLRKQDGGAAAPKK